MEPRDRIIELAASGRQAVAGGPSSPPHSAARPVIRRLSGLDEARASWTMVAPRTDNLFSTWDWADVWWRHFGAGRTLQVAIVLIGETPVAVLPLYSERLFRLDLMRFVGNGVGDQLGPVCGSGDAAVAADGLRSVAASADVLLAERMPADRDWTAELRGREIRHELCPLIDLQEEGDWDSFLAARSSNFRKQVRSRARRMERLGVRFRLVVDAARLQDDINALFALHSARWREQASVTFRDGRAFHRDFAERALQRGWLRLWMAEAEGTPIAAWYGYRYEGVEYYYQSGRDPAWDRHALGAAILEHSIREAFNDGMREYRMLRGDEAYKRRYASRQPSLTTVAAAYRPVGRAAVRLLDMLAGSRAGRRLVKRLG